MRITRRFDVEYEATNSVTGMTADEAREAFAHAVEIVRVTVSMRGKIKKVLVREDRWADTDERPPPRDALEDR